MKLIIHQDDMEKEARKESPFVEICETKDVIFILESFKSMTNPTLIIGDLRVELRLNGIVDETYQYVSSQSKYFVNHVGLALIELEFDEGADPEFVTTINVLSSKITTKRLNSMLNYIARADTKFLHCCFSKTLFNSKGGEFEYIDFYYKLIHTEKSLNYLWENRNKFINQPCKRIISVEKIKKYELSDLIDDKSYSWLLQHLDELELTNIPEQTLLNRYGKKFSAGQISTRVVEDDLDIFENQVVYTYLIAIKKFIDDVYDANRSKLLDLGSDGEFTDIIPYIQNFAADKVNAKKNLIIRINALVNNCLKLFNDKFKTSYIPYLRPRVTQYSSRHNHYMTLFELIDSWWKISASDFSDIDSDSLNNYLFSIKSMDKIYELFVLLNIIDDFTNNGFKVDTVKHVNYKTFPSLNTEAEAEREVNETNNFFVLSDDNFTVNLYIEPIIYPYRENLNIGELFIIDKAPDSREAHKLSNAKYVRTPDYIIEILQKRSNKRFIYILDAKYSKYDTVLNDRLPTKVHGNGSKKKPGLIDKYFHGIRIFDNINHRVVDGIFATFITGGRSRRNNKVCAGIAHDFTIYGEQPIAPFVDLVKFSPEEELALDNEFKEHSLLIERIISYTRKCCLIPDS